jgi:antibiotic biosynthesis monooxygenase (ABM) superfamily enzyme
MIYFTQLIYVKPGCEAIFHQFEDIALPLLEKYNGKLLLRCRPDAASFVETNYGKPYEIHLVSFASPEDFENFKHNPDRQSYLHLKEASVERVVLIEGRLI